MPTKKHRSKSKSDATKGEVKRYMQWLSSPGKKTSALAPAPFTDNYNWRIFRIMAEFIEGFEFLSKLKKEVSIFGSARIMQNNPYYKIAKELGYMLGKKGYTVITGGGPGIMEAANWERTMPAPNPWVWISSCPANSVATNS